MRELLKQNRWYVTLVVTFWILGSICLLTIPKGHTIAWLHQSNYQAYYPVWLYITQLAETPTVLLVFLALLFTNRWKAAAFALLTLISMSISITLKDYFSAPRPYLYFQQHDTIHLLNMQYFRYPLAALDSSFPSGHTIMAFALYTFLAINVVPSRIGSLLCFSLALLVGLSRVALSQHFFEDVFVGSIIGFSLAWIISYYLKLIKPHI